MSYSASGRHQRRSQPDRLVGPAGLQRAPDVSTATWTAVVNDIASQMGSTEGSYAAALPVVFAEAAGYGVTFTSEAQVLNYLVRRALATAPGAAVSGTLYLGNTSTPLPQTTVSLADGTGEPQYATTSWYNGQFDIWDVTPGTYELTARGVHASPGPAGRRQSDGQRAVGRGAGRRDPEWEDHQRRHIRPCQRGDGHRDRLRRDTRQWRHGRRTGTTRSPASSRAT